MKLSLAFVIAAVHAAAAASVPRSHLSTRWPYDSTLGPESADCWYAQHLHLTIYMVNVVRRRATYPIAVSAENALITNVTVPAGTDNTTFVTALTQRFATNLPALANFTAEFLSNGTKQAVAGTYNISGIFCTPKNDVQAKDTVQLLIHGSE
jgi:hypothetical protein